MINYPQIPDARKALLVIMYNVAPNADKDFDSWYIREHLSERVEIEGFERGSWYHGLANPLEQLTLYEARDTSVFTSDAYRSAAQGASPQTLRMAPYFRDMTRITSDSRLGFGLGRGTYLLATSLRARKGEDEQGSNILPALEHVVNELRGGGTIAVRALQANSDGDEWLLLIDLSDETAVDSTRRALDAAMERLALSVHSHRSLRLVITMSSHELE